MKRIKCICENEDCETLEARVNQYVKDPWDCGNRPVKVVNVQIVAAMPGRYTAFAVLERSEK